jgi:hypothetical protein
MKFENFDGMKNSMHQGDKVATTPANNLQFSSDANMKMKMSSRFPGYPGKLVASLFLWSDPG